MYGEGGAHFELTLHINPAVVRLDKLLHEVQSKAGATDAPRRTLVAGVERIKDALEAVLVDPTAGVDDLDAHSL